MSTNKKDPVTVAREILEGKNKKTVDEGLKKALKVALEDEQEEFEYEGKTYSVADFDDIEEANVEVIYDDEKDSGGETVPTPDVSKAKEGKKTPLNKTKPSDADDNDVADAEKVAKQAQKEGVELDVDEAIGDIEESDDMVALFNGEDELSEDFKDKARTIFETAVRARVKDIAVALEAQANARIAEITEANKDELTESLDDYLSYVVEEWVKENQVALERGVKSDIAESFMMGLKNLFEAHYIDMPDEKFDVVTNLEDTVEDLKSKINEEIQKNVELNKELNNSRCSEVFTDVSDGLVDTQIEKLAKLAEGLEYEDTEQFKEKLSLIKDSYFGNGSSRSSSVLNEDEDTQLEDSTGDPVYRTPEMKKYSHYMDRVAKHNNY